MRLYSSDIGLLIQHEHDINLTKTHKTEQKQKYGHTISSHIARLQKQWFLKTFLGILGFGVQSGLDTKLRRRKKNPPLDHFTCL